MCSSSARNTASRTSSANSAPRSPPWSQRSPSPARGRGGYGKIEEVWYVGLNSVETCGIALADTLTNLYSFLQELHAGLRPFELLHTTPAELAVHWRKKLEAARPFVSDPRINALIRAVEENVAAVLAAAAPAP